MPSSAQVTNRQQAPPRERHFTATVTAAGRPTTVALDPGGATILAMPLNAATHAVNVRVLVLCTPSGNWIVGAL